MAQKEERKNFLNRIHNNKNTLYRIDEKTFPNKSIRKQKILDLLSLLDLPEFRQDYRTHFLIEFLALKENFPDLDFDYSARIKSPEGRAEKVDRKIYKEKKSGNIYDTYGSKIVIYSINGSNLEQNLVDACYQVEEFLKSYDPSLTSLGRKDKDYIKHPKASGYRALHITRIHNAPCGVYPSEVQIRTSHMEEQQQFGPSSHKKSYKVNNHFVPEFWHIRRSKKTKLYKVYEVKNERAKKEDSNYLSALEK